jgi:DNA polymerase I-like protein with 3'-5' exonuclease and polymerase domains
MGVRQLLQVHDSDLFEVDYDGDEQWLTTCVLPSIAAVMTNFPWDPPTKVDIKYGDCWGRMKKWTPNKPVEFAAR